MTACKKGNAVVVAKAGGKKYSCKVTVKPKEAQSASGVTTLSVRDVNISFGESSDSVIAKLGTPARTDKMEYVSQFMVYNDNYADFVMIAVAKDKVVGWYTDAESFSYNGITPDSDIDDINEQFGKSSQRFDSIEVYKNEAKISFLMDMVGDETVDGVYVMSSAVKRSKITKSLMKTWEKEIFDITNSFRARNNKSKLVWSKQAEKSAYLHSKDMLENDFFEHDNPDGLSPFDRMEAQGIDYRSAGENIASGSGMIGNAADVTFSWINSPEHRSNMLCDEYTHLGNGYICDENSYYSTQNFYEK